MSGAVITHYAEVYKAILCTKDVEQIVTYITLVATVLSLCTSSLKNIF